MRTLAIVLGGVGAGGLAAVLAFASPTPQAQQTQAPADSITAPAISDTGYVAKGTKVVAIDTTENRIVVRPVAG